MIRWRVCWYCMMSVAPYIQPRRAFLVRLASGSLSTFIHTISASGLHTWTFLPGTSKRGLEHPYLWSSWKEHLWVLLLVIGVGLLGLAVLWAAVTVHTPSGSLLPAGPQKIGGRRPSEQCWGRNVNLVISTALNEWFQPGSLLN